MADQVANTQVNSLTAGGRNGVRAAYGTQEIPKSRIVQSNSSQPREFKPSCHQMNENFGAKSPDAEFQKAEAQKNQDIHKITCRAGQQDQIQIIHKTFDKSGGSSPNVLHFQNGPVKYIENTQSQMPASRIRRSNVRNKAQSKYIHHDAGCTAHFYPVNQGSRTRGKHTLGKSPSRTLVDLVWNQDSGQRAFVPASSKMKKTGSPEPNQCQYFMPSTITIQKSRNKSKPNQIQRTGDHAKPASRNSSHGARRCSQENALQIRKKSVNQKQLSTDCQQLVGQAQRAQNYLRCDQQPQKKDNQPLKCMQRQAISTSEVRGHPACALSATLGVNDPSVIQNQKRAQTHNFKSQGRSPSRSRQAPRSAAQSKLSSRSRKGSSKNTANNNKNVKKSRLDCKQVGNLQKNATKSQQQITIYSQKQVGNWLTQKDPRNNTSGISQEQSSQSGRPLTKGEQIGQRQFQRRSLAQRNANKSQSKDDTMFSLQKSENIIDEDGSHTSEKCTENFPNHAKWQNYKEKILARPVQPTDAAGGPDNFRLISPKSQFAQKETQQYDRKPTYGQREVHYTQLNQNFMKNQDLSSDLSQASFTQDQLTESNRPPSNCLNLKFSRASPRSPIAQEYQEQGKRICSSKEDQNIMSTSPQAEEIEQRAAERRRAPCREPSINRLRSYSPRVNLSQLLSQNQVVTKKFQEANQIRHGTLLPQTLQGNRAAPSHIPKRSEESDILKIFQPRLFQKVLKKTNCHPQQNLIVRNRSQEYFQEYSSPQQIAGNQIHRNPISNIQTQDKSKERQSKLKSKHEMKHSPSISQEIPKKISLDAAIIAKEDRTYKLLNEIKAMANYQNITEVESMNFQKRIISQLSQDLNFIDTEVINDCFFFEIEKQVVSQNEVEPSENITITEAEFSATLDRDKARRSSPEMGSLVHFLSYTGKFDLILDFLLKRKRRSKLMYNESNPATKMINNGRFTIDLTQRTSPPYGNTSLHLACQGLQKKAIERLLLSRVDASAQNSSDMDTPLHVLIKAYEREPGSREMVEDLIQVVLPFSEESLGKRNQENNEPRDLIQSESLKQIFNEHFGSFGDKGLDQAPQALNKRKSNSSNQEIKHKNSNEGSSDNYEEMKIEDMDEFAPNQLHSNRLKQTNMNPNLDLQKQASRAPMKQIAAVKSNCRIVSTQADKAAAAKDRRASEPNVPGCQNKSSRNTNIMNKHAGSLPIHNDLSQKQPQYALLNKYNQNKFQQIHIDRQNCGNNENKIQLKLQQDKMCKNQQSQESTIDDNDFKHKQNDSQQSNMMNENNQLDSSHDLQMDIGTHLLSHDQNSERIQRQSRGDEQGENEFGLNVAQLNNPNITQSSNFAQAPSATYFGSNGFNERSNQLFVNQNEPSSTDIVFKRQSSREPGGAEEEKEATLIDQTEPQNCLETPQKERKGEYQNISSLKENIKVYLNEEMSGGSRMSRASERKQTITRTLRGKKMIGESVFGAENYKTNEKQNDQAEEIGAENFIAHQLLGTGSFGEVFLVEEIATKQLYAMKVLSKEKIREQKLLKYAFAERSIMAEMTKINHPFAVKIKYAFQTRESLFMIIQFCSGGDLSQYLELEGSFDEQKAKGYISEIICAIESLHQKDIIFRDLKPDNIVLDAEGHALLTDFGLSRQGVKGHIRGAASFCGSYAYLAPEMIEKRGHGKAVDIYLIGVVLYEFLTGMPPFYNDNKDILFDNIRKQALIFPANVAMSPECKDLLIKLLEKDPFKRLENFKGTSRIKAIKQHQFFENIDWAKVERRELKQPKAYLSEMAMNVIKKQPYVLRDHPRTKGERCAQGEEGWVEGWEMVCGGPDDIVPSTQAPGRTAGI